LLHLSDGLEDTSVVNFALHFINTR
jgi:hypothetical protein